MPHSPKKKLLAKSGVCRNGMFLFIKETLGTKASECKHPDSGLSYMNYTSSVLNAINAVASEVSLSAPSSSNQTIANFAMGDVLETTYSSMGNRISSIVANSIFSRFSF